MLNKANIKTMASKSVGIFRIILALIMVFFLGKVSQSQIVRYYSEYNSAQFFGLFVSISLSTSVIIYHFLNGIRMVRGKEIKYRPLFWPALIFMILFSIVIIQKWTNSIFTFNLRLLICGPFILLMYYLTITDLITHFKLRNPE